MADVRPLARSPLSHLRDHALERQGGPVLLRELPLLGLLDLRLGAAETTARSAVEAALGFALPGEPNRATERDGLVALWLGPDEFLIVTPPGREEILGASLAAALAPYPAYVTDVSDGRTVIELGGHRARDVLAKGCSLDLHPRVFAPGQCAQSGLAKARIILRQIDDSPRYQLFVERSLAEYLFLWLIDAAGEYDADR
jgi:sarcosine oxidase subunit gamma